MAIAQNPPRLTPELRATLFFITMYMGAGVTVMYGSIWLSEQGISSEQIGVINAFPILLLLAINLFVGRLADKADDWRQVIVVGALIGGVAPLGLFFAEGFWGILLVWTLASVPIAAVGPVMDAATVRMTRRNGTDFGTIRAWGTVGHMSAIALTGYFVVWFGSAVFLPLFAGMCILRALVSLQLPNFRAPPPELTSAVISSGASKLREVMKPWFLLPLLGFAMVFGTHLILNAFAALLWKAQGIPEDVIGPLIALGAGAEAAMMFAWRRFSGRFSARKLILLSAMVTVVRWTAMAFSPPVLVLVFLQMLHSVTFALGFLGCVHFIANWTSEDIAAEAQSFFVVLQQGMAVIALVGFGWLVGMMGPHAYFVAAAFAALGAVLIWLSLRMVQPRT